MSKRGKTVAALFFTPLVISLIIGEEFWPITSFPMYSKPYQRFVWPSVQVRTPEASSWTPILDEECYGRLGYVRFHFSALRFGTEKRAGAGADALTDLTTSLAKEIARTCPDRNWVSLKVVLLQHDVRTKQGPTTEFVRDLTAEVPIAP